MEARSVVMTSLWDRYCGYSKSSRQLRVAVFLKHPPSIGIWNIYKCRFRKGRNVPKTYMSGSLLGLYCSWNGLGLNWLSSGGLHTWLVINKIFRFPASAVLKGVFKHTLRTAGCKLLLTRLTDIFQQFSNAFSIYTSIACSSGLHLSIGDTIPLFLFCKYFSSMVLRDNLLKRWLVPIYTALSNHIKLPWIILCYIPLCEPFL